MKHHGVMNLNDAIIANSFGMFGIGWLVQLSLGACATPHKHNDQYQHGDCTQYCESWKETQNWYRKYEIIKLVTGKQFFEDTYRGIYIHSRKEINTITVFFYCYKTNKFTLVLLFISSGKCPLIVSRDRNNPMSIPSCRVSAIQLLKSLICFQPLS